MELAALQEACFLDVVRHAAVHVPLYRRIYREAGVAPDDIRSLNDLRSLPCTTRDEMQRASADGSCLTEGIDRQRLQWLRTSGSSGKPLTLWRESWEEVTLSLLRYRKMLAAGLPLVGRMAILRVEAWEVPKKQSRLQPLRRHPVSCLLSPDRMLKQLLDIRPVAVGGNAGAIAEVARLVGARERRRLSVQSIIAGGETVSEAARRDIETGFGVPFCNFYGCYEGRLIALQKPGHRDLSVNEAGVLVEMLDGDRPVGEGEEGEVVITALHSYSMPFIRYRLGDLAIRGVRGVSGDFATGSIRRVQGRMLELFHLSSGRRVHPYLLSDQLVLDAPWMRRFRITQKAPNDFHCDVAPAHGFTPSQGEVAAVSRSMVSMLDEPIQVSVRLVDEIRPLPNGKYQQYVPFRPQPVG